MPELRGDNVAARLRGTQYLDANELARDLAASMEARERQPSTRRGLLAGTIAGPQGGTSLDVGNNAAARTSASLQPPQRGFYARGGALGTRTQARAELEHYTAPGIIVSVANDGDNNVLAVHVPASEVPTYAIDPVTGQNTATRTAFGDLYTLAGQAAAGTLSADRTTVEVTVPKPGDAEAAYEAGQVVDVSVARQYDVRTHWVQVDGRRMPVNSERLASESRTIAARPGTDVPAGEACSRIGVNCTLGTSGTANSEGQMSVLFKYTPS